MDQSTVLLLVGIIGNLVLVLLLVVAWRLLMGNRSARGQDVVTLDEQYDEQYDDVWETAPTGAPGEAEVADDELAGLFRFDSWTADLTQHGDNFGTNDTMSRDRVRRATMRNGRSNAMGG